MRSPLPAAGSDPASAQPARRYWDRLAAPYQRQTVISCREVHYGPLIPGESHLRLLPPVAPGLRCFEAGSGAAQNAIALARQGAWCVAADLSERQLAAGRELARRHRVRVAFLQADLAQLPLAAGAGFDVVLSAYALPFVTDPAGCVQALAAVLRPGGVLVLSTAHPLAAGEWLELDGSPGLFLPSYFRPPADRRQRQGGEAVCQAAPLSTVFGWLTDAGLAVEDLREPEALPVRALTPAQRRRQVPYWSRAWLAVAERFAQVPVVAIFKARKPLGPPHPRKATPRRAGTSL